MAGEPVIEQLVMVARHAPIWMTAEQASGWASGWNAAVEFVRALPVAQRMEAMGMRLEVVHHTTAWVEVTDGTEHDVDAEKHLFGLVGAEHLYDDPATVWESEIEPFGPHADRIEVEEWTVAPQRNHLPDAGSLLEWVHDHACDRMDVDEGWCDHMVSAIEKPDVVAATEALLDLIASKNQYLMADQLVATHVITFDAKGEPLYGGEPMYHKAPALITDHGFAWIGQSMASCESCGQPLYEHEGVQVNKRGASPFDPEGSEIVSPQEAARRMPLFGHYAGITVDA